MITHLTQYGGILNQLIASAILITVILLFQLGTNQWINKRQFRSMTYRRRWTVGLRNLRLLLIAVGLILIWATELRTAALSAVAILAAIVIGTKELIMCLLGSVIKTGSNAFTLGDRIRVNDVEGDVIDQNLLSTHLQEVSNGQYSGRMVTIPNSMFLNQAIYNSTLAGGGAVFGMLTIKLARSENWNQHEVALLQAAESCCAETKDSVNKAIKNLKHEGIDPPSTQPRTLIKVEDKDTLSLTLRYPATAEKKLKIEQAILRNYLSTMQHEPTKAPSSS